MKISFTSLDGYRHTAYLDEDEPTGGVMTGVYKHTDTPVLVRWDADREEWFEVAE